MSRVYDNWERLVEAVLKREDFRRLALCDSFSSSSSSSFQSSPEHSHDLKDIEVVREMVRGGRTVVPRGEQEHGPLDENVTRTFTFRSLAEATRNFHVDCLLDEGGFGKLYKGLLEFNGSSDVVAIKQYDLNGLQGNREFLVEVLTLSALHHPNLVRIIGYCADGNNRLVVTEYMPNGSLYDHLHLQEPRQGREHLDWNSRMKIAAGIAKGLEYLHHKASPSVIHRNVKSPSIMLGEGYDPKIVNFGLAKLGPVGDKTHVSTRVMGTHGYCAPEYAMTGKLSQKADVYSFGVVLLETISGRKVFTISETGENLHLVAWARPLLKDKRNWTKIVDPALSGHYPVKALYQAISVAAMCVADEAEMRPTMDGVTTALVYVSSQKYDPHVQNSTDT